MMTIPSLENLCVSELIANLAKSRAPFEFGALAPLPEALVHLVLNEAWSRRSLCDGVLSGALGPALTVLDLSETRSLESLSGRLFEQVSEKSFANLRHFALDCTPAYAAAPSLLPPSASGSTVHSDNGGSASSTTNGVCLADPTELLAFANKVLAGAASSLERFELTGCSCLDGALFRGLEACGHGRVLGAAALTVVCLPHCKPSGNDVVSADLLLGQALRALEGLECLSLRGWQCIDDQRLAKLVSLLLDAAPRLEALDLSDCCAGLHTLRVLAGPTASAVSPGGGSTKSSLRSALGMPLLPGPCLAHLSLEGCPLGQLAPVSGGGSSSSSSSVGSSSDTSSRAAVAEVVQLVGTLVAARGPEALSLRKCWALGQKNSFALQRQSSGSAPPSLSSLLDLLQQASGTAADDASEAAVAAVAAAAAAATANTLSDDGRGESAAPLFAAAPDDFTTPRSDPPLVASLGWAALQSFEVVVPMETTAGDSPMTTCASEESTRGTPAMAPFEDAGLFGNFSLSENSSNNTVSSVASPDRLSYSDLLAVGMSPPEAQAALVAAQHDDNTAGFGDDFLGGPGGGGSLTFPGGRARGDSDVGDAGAQSGADLARLHPGLALSLEAELTDFLEDVDGPLTHDFSSAMVGIERRLVHWMASTLGLQPESIGHGVKRRVRVTKPAAAARRQLWPHASVDGSSSSSSSGSSHSSITSAKKSPVTAPREGHGSQRKPSKKERKKDRMQKLRSQRRSGAAENDDDDEDDDEGGVGGGDNDDDIDAAFFASATSIQQGFSSSDHDLAAAMEEEEEDDLAVVMASIAAHEAAQAAAQVAGIDVEEDAVLWQLSTRLLDQDEDEDDHKVDHSGHNSKKTSAQGSASPTSSEPRSPPPAVQWTCPRCTLLNNSPATDRCMACDSPGVGSGAGIDDSVGDDSAGGGVGSGDGDICVIDSKNGEGNGSDGGSGEDGARADEDVVILSEGITGIQVGSEKMSRSQLKELKQLKSKKNNHPLYGKEKQRYRDLKALYMSAKAAASEAAGSQADDFPKHDNTNDDDGITAGSAKIGNAERNPVRKMISSTITQLEGAQASGKDAASTPPPTLWAWGSTHLRELDLALVGPTRNAYSSSHDEAILALQPLLAGLWPLRALEDLSLTLRASSSDNSVDSSSGQVQQPAWRPGPPSSVTVVANELHEDEIPAAARLASTIRALPCLQTLTALRLPNSDARSNKCNPAHSGGLVSRLHPRVLSTGLLWPLNHAPNLATLHVHGLPTSHAAFSFQALIAVLSALPALIDLELVGDAAMFADACRLHGVWPPRPGAGNGGGGGRRAGNGGNGGGGGNRRAQGRADGGGDDVDDEHGAAGEGTQPAVQRVRLLGPKLERLVMQDLFLGLPPPASSPTSHSSSDSDVSATALTLACPALTSLRCCRVVGVESLRHDVSEPRNKWSMPERSLSFEGDSSSASPSSTLALDVDNCPNMGDAAASNFLLPVPSPGLSSSSPSATTIAWGSALSDPSGDFTPLKTVRLSLARVSDAGVGALLQRCSSTVATLELKGSKHVTGACLAPHRLSSWPRDGGVVSSSGGDVSYRDDNFFDVGRESSSPNLTTAMNSRPLHLLVDLTLCKLRRLLIGPLAAALALLPQLRSLVLKNCPALNGVLEHGDAVEAAKREAKAQEAAKRRAQARDRANAAKWARAEAAAAAAAAATAENGATVAADTVAASTTPLSAGGATDVVGSSATAAADNEMGLPPLQPPPLVRRPSVAFSDQVDSPCTNVPAADKKVHSPRSPNLSAEANNDTAAAAENDDNDDGDALASKGSGKGAGGGVERSSRKDSIDDNLSNDKPQSATKSKAKDRKSKKATRGRNSAFNPELLADQEAERERSRRRGSSAGLSDGSGGGGGGSGSGGGRSVRRRGSSAGGNGSDNDNASNGSGGGGGPTAAESATSSGGTSSDGCDDDDDDDDDGRKSGGKGGSSKRRGGGSALRRCLTMPSLVRISIEGCDALVAVRIAAPKLLHFEALQCPRLEEIVLPHAQVLHTLAANHCARLRNVLPLGLGRGGGGGGAAGRGLERLRVAEFIHAKALPEALLRSLVEHCRDLRRLVVVGAGGNSSGGVTGDDVDSGSALANQQDGSNGDYGADNNNNNNVSTTPNARRRGAGGSSGKKKQQKPHNFGGGDFHVDERLTARVGKAGAVSGGLRTLGDRRPLLVVVRAKKELTRDE